MNATPLVLGHDAEGRPTASPPGGTEDMALAGLARFLGEEVHWPYYASLLLDQAIEAQETGESTTASGDAYAVQFDRDAATIEHLYRTGQPPVVVPIETLIAALRDWCDHISGV
ncbi:MAG: hypothetical protein AB7F35_03795 [Acetobacteraceae bacterium]